jgi:nitrous oxide reductase
MVTIILAVALLVALTGLGFEIGVASWNIHRARRYRCGELVAKYTTHLAVNEQQDMAKKLATLDAYTSKISWLLNFLYNRYDKFNDLEMEVEEGLKGVTGDTPIGEAEAKYKDLKKALEIIRVTMNTSERMENLINSITSQLSQIMDDFREEEEKKPESEKPAEDTKEESPKFESAE